MADTTFRCDTGDLARLPQFTPNIYQIGVGVALASLSAFFIGLILAYSLRIQVQPVWRQFHVPNYLWFSTAALAASSAVLEGAKYSLRRAAISKYRRRLNYVLLWESRSWFFKRPQPRTCSIKVWRPKGIPTGRRSTFS